MKDSIRGAVKSLTIWFNTILLAILAGLPDVLAALPQLQPYISDGVYKQLMAVAIIGNILLRFRTSKALAEK